VSADRDKPLRIGIAGLGTVGAATARLLFEHADLLQVRCGRPIALTAGTAMLAAVPIALDPIFSGLAWALIFGLTVSTAFTLVVVPVVYDLVYRNRPGHGLPAAPAEETT